MLSEYLNIKHIFKLNNSIPKNLHWKLKFDNDFRRQQDTPKSLPHVSSTYVVSPRTKSYRY